MDLSNFIFNGQFQELKIGSDIQNLRMPFCKVTDEDGDIPSLYNLEGKNGDFQFTALNNIVVGISFDFQYEPEKLYMISVEKLKFELGYNTSFQASVIFLGLTNLDFDIQTNSQEESFEIEFKKSGVLLSFSKKNLIKASVFDLDLYEKISNYTPLPLP